MPPFGNKQTCQDIEIIDALILQFNLENLYLKVLLSNLKGFVKPFIFA